MATPTEPPAEFDSSLVQSRFVPQRPSLVKGVVVEPLPNGVYRVELENGAKILAHVTDREGGFERFGDEGTAVGQEDVPELQGDQAERGGSSDLLEDPKAQAAAGVRS